MASCLARLSRTLAPGTDQSVLMEQFLDHRKVAETAMEKNPDLPARAWQEAVRRTQAVRHSSARWPADALLPILMAFLVCPGSTTGIEQAFSKFTRLTGEHWHGTDDAEEHRLVLRLWAAETRQAPPVEVFKAARRIWVACLGPSRVSGPGRAPSLGF